MCLLCIEVAKQKLTPQEFWNNYREFLMNDDSDHWREIIQEVKKTSEDYQKELASYWS